MHIIPYMVSSITSKLDSHKAYGIDSVPAIVLKKRVSELAPVLFLTLFLAFLLVKILFYSSSLYELRRTI